ncbi:hypothetical protein, partial [Chroococcidiopsis cubana]|uniref:hypothetical protein n=1 Tax=Chroococcidiopsis cubana TaxID=171392 RepID=UPI0015E7DA1F
LKFICLRPDFAHFGQSITLDHDRHRIQLSYFTRKGAGSREKRAEGTGGAEGAEGEKPRATNHQPLATSHSPDSPKERMSYPLTTVPPLG